MNKNSHCRQLKILDRFEGYNIYFYKWPIVIFFRFVILTKVVTILQAFFLVSADGQSGILVLTHRQPQILLGR